MKKKELVQEFILYIDITIKCYQNILEKSDEIQSLYDMYVINDDRIEDSINDRIKSDPKLKQLITKSHQLDQKIEYNLLESENYILDSIELFEYIKKYLEKLKESIQE